MLKNAVRTFLSLLGVLALALTLAGGAPATGAVSGDSEDRTSVAEARRAKAGSAKGGRAVKRTSAARPRKVCKGRGKARRCTIAPAAPVATPAPAPEHAPPAPTHEAQPTPVDTAPQAAPASAPAGGDPSAYAFMFPNDGRPGRWNPCTAIHYKVNATNAPAGGTADLDEALRRLSAATGLSFAFDGFTNEHPQSEAGRYANTSTIISWANPGESNMLESGAAGVGGATATVNRDGSIRITRGFVVIDATQRPAPGFGRGFSQGALLLHELGHMAGLHHSTDRFQVMYPTITSDATGDWGDGDRAGLKSLGADNGCLA